MEENGMIYSRGNKENGSFRSPALVAATVLFFIFGVGQGVYAKSPSQKIFSSPEEAVQAVIEGVKADHTRSLLSIFGPGSRSLIRSGDPIEDREGREWFIKRYEEKSRLAKAPDRVTLYLGKDEWPFAIPLVKTEGGWRFDTEAGKREILARRIGKNELNAIQVCLAYVDAQKEFALRKTRQGEGFPGYAQRLVSTPGNQDGLYWETAEGEELSPMGPLFAAARDEGYGATRLVNHPAAGGGQPIPYHGYFYRILKAQGEHASGGAREYLSEGKMTGGFALIAYPARYCSSGVKSFIVNQDGLVYQKDLGKNSRNAAHALKAFDPDPSWVRVPQ
jgi:hypothetical protein